MGATNKFRDYRRAAELFLKRPDKALVFNSNIGWIVTGEHTTPLKADLIRLTAPELERETLNNDPTGIATWQSLTVKHNLHKNEKLPGMPE